MDSILKQINLFKSKVENQHKKAIDRLELNNMHRVILEKNS